jgi:hypothetical protein
VPKGTKSLRPDEIETRDGPGATNSAPRRRPARAKKQ